MALRERERETHTGGTILRESLARHRERSHASFHEAASFSVRTRRAPQRNRLKGTRGETRIAARTRETRNNHPIIKSLTRLRLLLNTVYLSIRPRARCSARCSVGSGSKLFSSLRIYEFRLRIFYRHLATLTHAPRENVRATRTQRNVVN